MRLEQPLELDPFPLRGKTPLCGCVQRLNRLDNGLVLFDTDRTAPLRARPIGGAEEVVAWRHATEQFVTPRPQRWPCLTVWVRQG